MRPAAAQPLPLRAGAGHGPGVDCGCYGHLPRHPEPGAPRCGGKLAGTGRGHSVDAAAALFGLLSSPHGQDVPSPWRSRAHQLSCSSSDITNPSHTNSGGHHDMGAPRISSVIRFAARLILGVSLLYFGALAGSAWRASTSASPLAAQGSCADRRCDGPDACGTETYLGFYCDNTGPTCRSRGCT